MAVRRVVANIAADRVADAKAFYGGVLDMRVAMDFGWIVTFAGECRSSVSRASEDPELPFPTSPLKSTIPTRFTGAPSPAASPSSMVRWASPGVCGASMSATRSGAWSMSFRIRHDHAV